jgi:hypothetical protein
MLQMWLPRIITVSQGHQAFMACGSRLSGVSARQSCAQAQQVLRCGMQVVRSPQVNFAQRVSVAATCASAGVPRQA